MSMVIGHLDRVHGLPVASPGWSGAGASRPRWLDLLVAPDPPWRPSRQLRAWLSRAAVPGWSRWPAWLPLSRGAAAGPGWLRRNFAAFAADAETDAAGPDDPAAAQAAFVEDPEAIGPGLPEPPPPAPTRDDAYLIRMAQAGDLDAFNLLVLRYERAVFNVCLRLLRDAGGAEDVTQDTFVRAWQSLDSFRGELIRPWLFRIATNRCYDLLRVRARRPAGSLDAEPYEIEPIWSTQGPADEAPDAHSLRRELSIHLERALSALPDDQRTVVLLADVQGCDYREVAEATGAALGTVKSRLSRARARLRQILQDDPEAGELFDRFLRHYDDQDEASQP